MQRILLAEDDVNPALSTGRPPARMRLAGGHRGKHRGGARPAHPQRLSPGARQQPAVRPGPAPPGGGTFAPHRPLPDERIRFARGRPRLAGPRRGRLPPHPLCAGRPAPARAPVFCPANGKDRAPRADGPLPIQVRRDHRPQRTDPPPVRAHRPDRPDRLHRAHHRRIRHGQGIGGHSPAPGQRTRAQALRAHPARAAIRKDCWNRSCSATNGGPSPVRWRASRAGSNWRTTAPCCSTRSANCRSACRPNCCG